MMRDPNIVGAGPIVGAGLVCQYTRGEGKFHIIGFEEVKEGLDHGRWRVEMSVSIRFPEGVVSVEVAEPDHSFSRGGEDGAGARGKEGCEGGGGIVVGTVVVDVED